MPEYELSQHAVTRMSQRGFRSDDVEAVFSCGTQIAPDAFVMRRADVKREVASLKRRIQQMERLENLKVVAEGDTVITCYRSGPVDQRRTFRKGRSAR